MEWTQVYAAIFIMALGLSLIFTPLCQILAGKMGFLDIPKHEQHKLHAKSTPLLGGLAMFSSWFFTCGAALIAAGFFLPVSASGNLVQEVAGIPLVRKELIIVVGCAAASMLMGTLDDKISLSARTKLIGQILIAVVTVTFGGVHITLFMNIAWLSWLVSVFWIVFLFNAINFFDNMDGLACGTAAIAFIFFTAAAIMNGQYFVACLGACSAGAAIGFWFYNHSPASIFMGDGGSHFLAYILAVISARVTYFNPDVSASRFSILIPLFILAVPVFDTFAVVVIRLLNHKPIYVGDHNHISHRFYHMGMTRKRAVLLVHLLCLISGMGALPLLWGDERVCMVLLAQGAAIFLLLTILQYSGRIHMENQHDDNTNKG
ncbi:MAG: undecaprenyl/decaprenyl-phosphate alpha-N-acetylglucosaminyl 1-phosphate transferase [Lentisphaeria bacterium]|nr:undecaprenyl/decaprenyl-phosphate alpha-N-acetylglucosaminyl 1-phosphate transferase [Lentisphaeria bacterium]